MNKQARTMVFIVVGLAVIVGVVALTRKPKEKAVTPPPAVSSNAAKLPDPAVQKAGVGANTIDYGKTGGFNPAVLTVKAGSEITIRNSSANVIEVNSEPHPQHTDNAELNVGAISPGQTKTIKVTKTGAFIYHNHLKTDETGILTVE